MISIVPADGSAPLGVEQLQAEGWPNSGPIYIGLRLDSLGYNTLKTCFFIVCMSRYTYERGCVRYKKELLFIWIGTVEVWDPSFGAPGLYFASPCIASFVRFYSCDHFLYIHVYPSSTGESLFNCVMKIPVTGCVMNSKQQLCFSINICRQIRYTIQFYHHWNYNRWWIRNSLKNKFTIYFNV